MALLKLLYYHTIEAGIRKGGNLGHKNIQTQMFDIFLVENCQVGKDKKFDFTPVH